MHAADATGTQFTQKGVAMAQRVGLFNPGNTKLDTRMARAKAFTAWALFNFQAYVLILHSMVAYHTDTKAAGCTHTFCMSALK
jgi:hypothetical protein